MADRGRWFPKPPMLVTVSIDLKVGQTGHSLYCLLSLPGTGQRGPEVMICLTRPQKPDQDLCDVIT